MSSSLTTMFRFAILLIFIGCWCPRGRAQMTEVGAIPEGLPASVRTDLDAQRTQLLSRRAALQDRLAQHNANCGHVAADSSAVATCRANQSSLIADIRQYNADVDAFNGNISQAKQKSAKSNTDCEAAAQQAERDRKQMERQLETNEMNQEELAEWTNLSAEAKKQAVEASISFVVGQYGEDVDQVRESVTKLDGQATALAGKAARSAKYERRMEYAAKFQVAADELAPKLRSLAMKSVAEKASDANEVWELAHNTMQHEFRVAAKKNESIREMLQDPGFKEAFSGEDVDTPGLDVLSALTEKALEETGNFALKATKYAHFTGPAVNAAVFVRDAWYSAALSAFSTEGVLEESDVASQFARSMSVLQLQYKHSVDALKACRERSVASLP
jgi:hypothetical protein